MTALTLPLELAEALLPSADPAVGQEANTLRRLFRAVGQDLDETFGFGKRLRDLDKACWDASTENWDGDGAPPVDSRTYERAKRFLEALAVSAPDPVVGIDPDGEVSFTWHRSPKAVFSASINRDGRVSYAGLFGPSTVYGTEYFVEELPKAVRTNLARLFPAGTQAGISE